jgi:hypothetical protein
VTSAGTQTANFVLAAPAPGTSCVLDTASWDAPTTSVPLSGDDASTSLALPFAYSHFGTRASTAFVSTNGVVNFLAAGAEYDNTTLPSAATPNAALYPLWDDLYMDASSSLLTGTFGAAPHRRFVIEWQNVAFLSDTSHRVSVQAVLYEDPSEPVRFQYRDVDQASIESGTSATVGIENAAGDSAITASYDSNLLYDGLAIRMPTATAPKVSIGDASLPEGASGQRLLRFNVSLSHPTNVDVQVPYATTGGTATASVDYTARSGTVTIPAGRTGTTLPVNIRGDAASEPIENFGVVLGAPVGAQLGRARATGRILNDDPSTGRQVGIGDASIVEGDSGTRTLRFTIGLSAPSSSPVTVGFATTIGTARAGTDYTPRTATVTIPAGATSVTVGVDIRPDTVADGTRTFGVQLSGARGAALGRRTGTARIFDDD